MKKKEKVVPVEQGGWRCDTWKSEQKAKQERKQKLKGHCGIF
jgi:hypothetical protein